MAVKCLRLPFQPKYAAEGTGNMFEQPFLTGFLSSFPVEERAGRVELA